MDTDSFGLSLKELKAIAKRIQSAHEKRSSLTYHGLQYWTCETGPPAVRFSPRMLGRALEELANNARPRQGRLPQGPLEPIPGIYVSPSVGHTDSQGAADANAASTLQRLRELRSLLTGDRIERLLRELSTAVAPDSRWKVVFKSTSTWLASEVRVPMPSGVIAIESSALQSVRVLVMNDVEWLFPDDWRLWAHFRECAAGSSRCLVVARRIALPTFSLLKALGAFGVQTYQLFCERERLEDLERHPLSTVWPRYKPVSAITQLSFVKYLTRRLRQSHPPLEETSLLRVGLAHGLDQDEAIGGHPAESLVRAAEEAGVHEQEEWLKNVRRFAVWAKYSRKGDAS